MHIMFDIQIVQTPCMIGLVCIYTYIRLGFFAPLSSSTACMYSSLQSMFSTFNYQQQKLCTVFFKVSRWVKTILLLGLCHILSDLFYIFVKKNKTKNINKKCIVRYICFTGIGSLNWLQSWSSFLPVLEHV